MAAETTEELVTPVCISDTPDGNVVVTGWNADCVSISEIVRIRVVYSEKQNK